MKLLYIALVVILAVVSVGAHKKKVRKGLAHREGGRNLVRLLNGMLRTYKKENRMWNRRIKAAKFRIKRRKRRIHKLRHENKQLRAEIGLIRHMRRLIRRFAHSPYRQNRLFGQCITRHKYSRRAGVIRARCPRGYTMVGGGMYNHYRHFNKLSAFEESMPEGNWWRCDTGFGPGKLTCYVRCCRFKAKCIIKAKRNDRAGVTRVHCPRGFVMVSGGVYNRYRHFNRHSGFEESQPEGNHWRCDLGFGRGWLYCYVRCCRFKKRHRCTTRKKYNGRAGVTRVGCPRGWIMVGGGLKNHYRRFNRLSAFEEAMPERNHYRCDMGFGGGKATCYARCCKG